MKITIITVCYNSGKTIESTIKSIINQTYGDIEYILVDGGSTDNTKTIIKKYSKKISKFISEKDDGIYDAINKGIKYATGEVIGMLNSDDIYSNKYVIEHVAGQFRDKEVDAIYGDLKYVHDLQSLKTVRYWKSGNYNRSKFLFGWMPPHPTFFLRRSVYENLGGYISTFRSAADYELMLRVLYRYKASVKYLPEVLVLMRDGGISNASFKNRLRANLEDQKAWVVNGLEPFFFTTWLKPIRKIPQFIINNHYNVKMKLS